MKQKIQRTIKQYTTLFTVIRTAESLSTRRNISWKYSRQYNNQSKSSFVEKQVDENDDQSGSDKTMRICSDEHGCLSNNFYGTLCVVLVAICILLCCCRYFCYEYAGIKKQLDWLHAQKTRCYVILRARQNCPESAA